MEELGAWTSMECLDSDALIGILRNSEGASELSERIDQMGKAATTSVNAYEILYGARKHGDQNKIIEAKKLLGKLAVFSFNESAADKASEIHAELAKKGEQLDMRDVFIGAVAIVNNLTVTTRNVKHFSKIKELKVNKW